MPPCSADATAVPNAFFGQGYVDILLDYFLCRGTEENLLDCSHHKAHADICSHSGDAGVNCSRRSTSTEVCSGHCLSSCPPGFTCESGSLRLVEGLVPGEGRVEVCLGGSYSSVCDIGWTSEDAQVACRQLGFEHEGTLRQLMFPLTDYHLPPSFPSAGAIALPSAFFGSASGRIRIGSVACTGSEEALLDCPYERDPICFHFEDAGILCQCRSAVPAHSA